MADETDPAKLARDAAPTYREMFGESREDTVRRIDQIIHLFDCADIDVAAPVWWRKPDGR